MRFKNAKIRSVATDPAQYNLETEPRGSAKFTVRSHVLSEVRRNAQRWVLGYQSPESKSKLYGDVLDCLALNPHLWPERYAVTPATYTNKKGGTSKWRNDLRIEEVAAWHEEHAGLTIVDKDTNAAVHAALQRLKAHPEISEFLGSGHHQVWVEAEYEDRATGLIVPVKSMIDIVPDRKHPVYGGCLGDLKSTRNASPRRFARDCYDYAYHEQSALYLDIYNAATGEERSDFIHVVQENFPPFEPRMPFLGQRFIEIGRITYQQTLAMYCRCVASGKWPSYDPEGAVAYTLPEPWMESLDAIFEPMDDEEEPENEAPTEEEASMPN